MNSATPFCDYRVLSEHNLTFYSGLVDILISAGNFDVFNIANNSTLIHKVTLSNGQVLPLSCVIIISGFSNKEMK